MVPQQTRAELKAAVAALIKRDPDDIPDEANLVQLGLTSMHLMQLTNGWRRAGMVVKFSELANNPTIAGWSATLAR